MTGPVRAQGFPLPDPLRLIATDLDGTIVQFGAGISDRTLMMLNEVERAGIHVVYVTGRPPRWLEPVIEATGHTGHAISANGAVTLDLADGSVVTQHAIDPEDILLIAERLRAAVPDVMLAVETIDGLSEEQGFRESRTPHRHEGLSLRGSGPLRSAERIEDLIGGDPVFKMVALSPESTPDSLLAAAREHVVDLATPTHSSATDALLEMGPLGVTKATGLADLARVWGINQREVVAFGDMPNDGEMLRWAHTGYAMADGHPEAIAAADHIAPPAVEDGVAQVIEPYLARLTGSSAN